MLSYLPRVRQINDKKLVQSQYKTVELSELLEVVCSLVSVLNSIFTKLYAYKFTFLFYIASASQDTHGIVSSTS